MKRFLMLAGVATVAGAMYVAAAPGSRQAAAPTARQFNALKKQVASLSKTLKAEKKDEAQVKQIATLAVGYIGACFLDTSGNIVTLGVNQFGTATAGFLFGTSGASTPRTALDVDTSGSPLAYLQEVNATCATSAPAALSRRSAHLLKLWGERSR